MNVKSSAGLRVAAAVFTSALGVLASSSVAHATACVVPDDGSGTVGLPPLGCSYVAPEGQMWIIDGLPAGDRIAIQPVLDSFFDVFAEVSTNPDGRIATRETYHATLALQMSGAGTLAGFNRSQGMGVQVETVSQPRAPGHPVQSFDTEMLRLQGQLPPGDPDFDLLRITAGSSFGLPSPGHTTLTEVSGGNWAVDSFFDITYRIDFVGTLGGPLSGRSGSTTGTIRLEAVAEPTVVPEVPEPATLVLLGSGLSGLVAFSRRRRET